MLTCPVTRPASEANAQVCVIGLCNRYANYAFGTPLKKPCCKKTTILGRYAIARTFEWPAKSSDVFGCPLLKQAASPKITEKNPYLRGQKGTSEDSDGLWWTSPMRLIRNQQVTSSNLVIGSTLNASNRATCNRKPLAKKSATFLGLVVAWKFAGASRPFRLSRSHRVLCAPSGSEHLALCGNARSPRGRQGRIPPRCRLSGNIGPEIMEQVPATLPRIEKAGLLLGGHRTLRRR